MESFYSKCTKLMIFAAIIFSVNTYGQNANDALRLGVPGLGSSARALGMGNSYVGLSDDGSASFFNPAGFGLIKKLEISGSLGYNKYDNNTVFFDNYTDYAKSSTSLNNLSFAFPFPTMRGSLVFGVAYHTTKDFTGTLKFNGFNGNNNSMIQFYNYGASYNIPYDLYLTDTTFNSQTNSYNSIFNGNLNQSGSIISTGSLDNWTFSGAIEAYKNLFLGINLNIITGTYNNNNDYYEEDSQGNYTNLETAPGDSRTMAFQSFHLNRILNWNISGWNAKFGVLYQVNNIARIGATVQFPKTYTVKEKFTVSGDALFGGGFNPSLNSSDYSDQVQYDIVTPYELSLGGSVSLQGLILSGQITQIDYTQLKFDNPSGLTTQYVAQQNKTIMDSLKSVLNFNIGAEYSVPNTGLRLRAGYMVIPSAHQSDPSSFDHKYLTFGAGYLLQEAVSIDVAYAHGTWKTYGDNYGNNVSRTHQDITSNHLILSMTYRF